MARGAHQLAFGVRATVADGQLDELRRRLQAMASGEGEGIAFESLQGVHFARLVLLEDSSDLRDRPIPASLLYISEIDAPLERHLDELTTVGGAGLDSAFALCEGYPHAPTPQTRQAFLQQRSVRPQAAYINRPGRTLEQIRQEARLREAIEDFLDAKRGELPAEPRALRSEIQRFVTSEPALTWTTSRAARPGVAWRVREIAHAVGIAIALLVATPLLLVVVPVWAIVLRINERRDPAPHVRPDRDHALRLAELEDHVAQNQFSAIGYLKPGWFRRTTIRVVLFLIDYGARHVFTRGSLAGVKTIHFARWIVLDDWRRAVFTSNYDNSLESYMDDFIDKVAFGLNASFSNGVGYPRTRWLFFEGAKREEEFKDYLRIHQIPTQVWYSAYPQLSVANVDNNARIRAGLVGSMSDRETRAWLRRL